MNFRTAPKRKAEPRDLFPGALEMMVLQTLRWQPMHGYALVQHIQQRSKELLQVEEGSLYPALQRMLKTGLVEAEWKISPTNRRVRTYKITSRGVKHLEHERSRFEQMLEGISLVLTPESS
ncbi:MAG: PadR family transcriptional regulator [Acidobacteriaceae bacterium]